MKTFLNILKNFFVAILILVSIVFINIYMVLQATSNMISKDNIKSVIKEVNISEVIDEKSVQEINDTFKEVGIPEEYTKEILENEEVKDMLGEVMGSLTESVLYDKEVPDINTNDIKDIFNSAKEDIIEKIKEDESVNISKEELVEIENSIDEFSLGIVSEIENNQEEINNSLKDAVDNIKENNETINNLKILQNIFKAKIYFLIGALVCYILIIILKLKDFAFLKTLGILSIFNGVGMLILSSFINTIINIIKGEMENYANIILKSSSSLINTYLTGGIIFLVSGIGLIIIKIIISNIKKKKIENIEGV